MELTPEEALLAAMLRRAIKDAQSQGTRQEEARWWLWEHAPSIAERAGVPCVDRFMNKDAGMGNRITV